MAGMTVFTMLIVRGLDTKDFSLLYSKKCSGILIPSKLTVCEPSTNQLLFNTSKTP